MGVERYSRLVTVQVGVTVTFESDLELTEDEQAGYATAVAVDAISSGDLMQKHPIGTEDPIGGFVRSGGVDIRPAELSVKLVYVEDEGGG